jgi:hypothetical protein
MTIGDQIDDLVANISTTRDIHTPTVKEIRQETIRTHNQILWHKVNYRVKNINLWMGFGYGFATAYCLYHIWHYWLMH